MAPKRPLEDPKGSTDPSDPTLNRAQKKAKQLKDARQISTQSSSSSTPASTSKQPLTMPSLTDLPPQMDLESAISSRIFQIRALQNAMRASRANATTRAWQLLPRAQRRRAASHNLLRLPSRLRSKGLHEMKSSNTDPMTRSEMRKRSSSHPLKRSKLRREELVKRAADASRRWLETHLWHSKRFRMTAEKGPKEFRNGRSSRWGWILAEQPNMKSQRATWRDALGRNTIHDASYDSWVRISITAQECKRPRVKNGGKGGKKMREERRQQIQEMFSPQAIAARKALDLQQATKSLEIFLQSAGIAKGWGEEWVEGKRECETTLLDEINPVDEDCQPSTSKLPLGFCQSLAPIRVLWVPSSSSTFSPSQDVDTKSVEESSSESRGAPARPQPLTQPPSTSTSVAQPVTDAISMLSDWNPIPTHASSIPKTIQKQRHTEALQNRSKKRLAIKAVASHPVPVRPTRELLLRIHPAAVPSLRKAIINAVKDMKAVGQLPSQTQPLSFTVEVPRSNSSSHTAPGPRGEASIHNFIFNITELNTHPDPDISAGASRRTSPAVQKAADRRASIVQKRIVRGIIKSSLGKQSDPKLKSKKKYIVGGSERNKELRKEKIEREREDEMIRKRRGEGWNTFELVGPDAGKVLGGVLKLVKSNDAKKKEAFQLLTRSLLPSDVPSSQILSLEVHDPRLSFPPSNSKSEVIVERSRMGAQSRNTLEKRREAAKILVDDGRLAVGGKLLTEGKTLPRFTKGDIDSRKAKQLLPGSPLLPRSEDDTVPIVLIQRTLTSVSAPASTSTSTSISSLLSGYTLLVPRGWGSAFWLSLVHTGSRVLGQDQIKQLAFEGSSLLYSSPTSSSTAPQPFHSPLSLAYPNLHIGTSSFTLEEKLKNKHLKEEWERRPKGKRVEFEKVGIDWPWSGEGLWSDVVEFGREIWKNGGGKEERREKKGEGEKQLQFRPWLLSVDQRVREVLKRSLTADIGRASPLNQLITFKHPSAHSISKVQLSLCEKALDKAVVIVNLRACRRGALHEGAGVYMLTDVELEMEWREVLGRLGKGEEEEERGENYGTESENEDMEEMRVNEDAREMEELKSLLGAGTGNDGTSSDAPVKESSRMGKRLENHLEKDDADRKALIELESVPRTSSQSLVGSVLLGGFSLSVGGGFAIAAISLRGYTEMIRRGKEFERLSGGEEGDDAGDRLDFALVRDRNGGVWRAARVELELA